MEDKTDKRSPTRVLKKPLRPEEVYWDCSVCTYRNGSEAFKCSMCDVRKGTSTRSHPRGATAHAFAAVYSGFQPVKKKKPRLNSQLVAQQVAQQFATTPPLKKTPTKRTFKKMRPRLKNVDRESAQHMAVTVSNVTVIITDYKLLNPGHSPSVTPERTSPVSPADSKPDPGPSNSSEVNGNGAAFEDVSS